MTDILIVLAFAAVAALATFAANRLLGTDRPLVKDAMFDLDPEPSGDWPTHRPPSNVWKPAPAAGRQRWLAGALLMVSSLLLMDRVGWTGWSLFAGILVLVVAWSILASELDELGSRVAKLDAETDRLRRMLGANGLDN